MTTATRRPTHPLTLVATLFAVLSAALVGTATPAAAHPLSTSAVLIDIDPHHASATIELPLDQLDVAWNESLTAATVNAATISRARSYVAAHLWATDADGRTWSTAVTGGHIEEVDEVDNLILDATLTPNSGSVGDFVLHYNAVVEKLISHRVFVSARYGTTGPYTTLAMLSWQSQSVPVASTVAAAAADQGFMAAVRLGVHHIATGSDHLLFLIMLLLPAPLVVAGRRWQTKPLTGRHHVVRSSVRVVHVVTAFAVGHSCTLVLGALGWVQAPTRLVEAGIALSVLVSAVHAIRPLVRRGEVLIAGGFGLLHGMAFATLLGSLDLSRSSFVATLLGFNLGIELTQLLVVALVMPSLILLSRNAAFPVMRLLIAATGAVVAAGWFAARTGLIGSNPAEPVGNVLVGHPLALAAALGFVALVLTAARRARPVARPGEPVRDATGRTQVKARARGEGRHRGVRHRRVPLVCERSRVDRAVSANVPHVSRPSGREAE